MRHISMLAVPLFVAYAPLATAETCTEGWHITGYFTPIEAEYDGPTVIERLHGEQLELYTAFLEELKIEGWGKLEDGRYLGYWDGAAQMFAHAPLDSLGNVLVVQEDRNPVAVDPYQMPHGTVFTIPRLPGKWGQMTYVATDIGPAIQGKDIDVYTGEGLEARAQAYYLTGDDKPNNRVCIQ